MAYKEAKKVLLSNLNLKFKIADVYMHTNIFTRAYQEAKQTKPKFTKV